MSEQSIAESPGTRAYVILSAIFAGAIVAANLIGTKVIPLFTIGGFQFTSSVGIFLFPLTFLVTDIIAEVYGPKATRAVITGTLVVLVIVLAVTAFATVLPPADRFAEQNEAYLGIFRSSLRILLASIVAFVLSQYHDVWAFTFWKNATKGRFLWLRNNASTVVSQLIDTVVFMLIAFWGSTERFTLAFVMTSMIPPYYFIKILTSLLDTPFVYLGVNLLRKAGVGSPPSPATGKASPENTAPSPAATPV